MNPWLTPSAVTAAAALAVALVTAIVAWQSHRTGTKALFLTELKGEIDLLRGKLEASDRCADDLRAVIEHQRVELANLTISEAECRRDNGRLHDRIDQLEGEMRQLRQTAESYARISAEKRS